MKACQGHGKNMSSPEHHEHESRPNIQITFRTLLAGGFTWENPRREPGYMIFDAYRYDEFGAKQRYCFVLTDGRLGEAQIANAKTTARRSNSQLVIIGEADDQIPQIDWLRFINLFGGPVFSSLPTESAFVGQLKTLAFNRLPDGLDGSPDDLFEIYVQQALEFIFAGKVLRYGQERRFEARPDGLAMPNPLFTALFDAKAYSNGYNVTMETYRQFSSYIKDFKRRYGEHRQRLNSFIVVSGEFQQHKNALENRAKDLLAEHGVPLAFLTAGNLADIIAILGKHPSLRRSINWGRIFSDALVAPRSVQAEIEALAKDRVIPQGKE
jgi:hypothetical protein